MAKTVYEIISIITRIQLLNHLYMIAYRFNFVNSYKILINEYERGNTQNA